MKNIPLALAVVLTCGTSTAQIDPLPNGIGVYFDEDATINTTTAEAGDTIHAYLVATRLTQTGPLFYWVMGGSFTDYLTDSIPFDIIYEGYHRGNGFSTCNSSENYVCFEVAYEQPLEATEITVLADLFITVPTPDPIGIFLLGGSVLGFSDSIYIDLFCHWQKIELHPQYHHCATINGNAPMSLQDSSWGGVKALYK